MKNEADEDGDKYDMVHGNVYKLGFAGSIERIVLYLCLTALGITALLVW